MSTDKTYMTNTSVISDNGNTLTGGILRYRYPILLVVSGVLIMLMTLFTPPYLDDWHYGFIYEKGGALAQRPIQTLGDLMESIHNYYLYKDGGRCIANGSAMVFLAFLGHKVFAVCNGVMFALMLHLFCLNFAGHRQNFFTVASVVLFSFGLLLPAFSHEVLWLDGSCNYLWCTVYILFFNYLLNKDIPKRWWPLLFIYSIVAGDTNEGIMTGLSIGYAVYYLSHFKLLTAQRLVMFIGLAIGVALLVLCPGVWDRALTYDLGDSILRDNDKHLFIAKALSLFLGCRLWLFYIALIAMIVMRKAPLLWGVAWVALLLFNLCIYSNIRQYYGLEMVSLIIVLSVVEWSKVKEMWSYIIDVTVILLLCVGIVACADNYRCFEAQDRALLNSQAKDITIFYDYPSVTFLRDKFCLNTIMWTYSTDDQDVLHTHIDRPRGIKRHYHKRSITALPLAMKRDIDAGKVTNEFLTDTSYPYYIRKWERGDSIDGYIELNKSKYADIPLLNLRKRYTIMQEPIGWKYFVTTIRGQRYLIIQRRPYIDDRIKAFQVWTKE